MMLKRNITLMDKLRLKEVGKMQQRKMMANERLQLSTGH